MIRREEPDAVWVIHQTAHARLAGVFAEHWLADFAPREALVLAALNHDAGWPEFEQRPRVNAAGWPRSFLEMGAEEHFTIWERSIWAMFAQDRYAGLLTSLHCAALYERRLHVPPAVTAARQAEIEAFLSKWRAWQDELVATLRDHPHYGPAVQPETLARNLRLLQVWDYLSLMLCWGPVKEDALAEVPFGEETGTLRLAGDGQRALLLDPYPLDAPLTLWVDARRVVGGPFSDDAALQRALADVPYQPLAFEVRPLR